ncbi:hypothetical protein D3C75_333240 [compost metagenome]
MRKFCKFCGAEMFLHNSPLSSGRVCSSCRNDLVWYRRRSSGATVILDHDMAKLKRIESMLEDTRRRGEYMPKWYTKVLVDCTCNRCGDAFYDQFDSTVCPICASQEAEYKQQHRLNPESGAVKKIDRYYISKQQQGFEVPALFYKRKRRLYF